jgi:uncharacterized membrane protein
MSFDRLERSAPGWQHWAILAAGGVAVAYGVSRLRARNGHSGTRTALSGDRGLHVRESVRVEKPLDEVYRFWRQPEHLPRVMDRAEIINEIPDKVIGWRSAPASNITAAGAIRFEPARGGRSTQVSVHLQYAPTAGRAGALVASMLGREPSQTVREDLRRVKQLLEAGESPRATAEAGGARR